MKELTREELIEAMEEALAMSSQTIDLFADIDFILNKQGFSIEQIIGIKSRLCRIYRVLSIIEEEEEEVFS